MEFEPIIHFSKYKINRTGTVIGPKNTILSPWINHKGYIKVSMIDDSGKKSNYFLHRILALQYVEIPERHLDKCPSKLQVDHINGINTDNDISNLEWVTQKENLDRKAKMYLEYKHSLRLSSPA